MVSIAALVMVFRSFRSCLAPDFPLDLLPCTQFVLLKETKIDVCSLFHAFDYRKRARSL